MAVTTLEACALLPPIRDHFAPPNKLLHGKAFLVKLVSVDLDELVIDVVFGVPDVERPGAACIDLVGIYGVLAIHFPPTHKHPKAH